MAVDARATSLTNCADRRGDAETGLTARMIRYYENRGRIRSASRGPRAHRHYAEDDIERLRVLRALLAAGVSPIEAIGAVDGQLDAEQRRRITTSLDQLLEATRDPLRRLRQPGLEVEPSPSELRIGLLFDLFLARHPGGGSADSGPSTRRAHQRRAGAARPGLARGTVQCRHLGQACRRFTLHPRRPAKPAARARTHSTAT